MIRFRCRCGKKLKAEESIIGRRVRCPDCQTVNRVPESSTARSRRERLVAANAGEVAGGSAPIEISVATGSDEASLIPTRPLKSPAERIATPPKADTIDSATDSEATSTSNSPGSPFDFDFDLDALKRATTTPSPSSGRNPASDIPASSADAVAPDDLKIAPVAPTRTTRKRQPLAWKPLGLWLMWIGGAVAVAALLIGGIAWLMSGPVTFPESFENRPAVKHYRYCWQQYDKARRSMKLMGEAYIAAQSPDPEQVAEVRDTIAQAQTGGKPYDTLLEAWTLIENGRELEAQKLLNQESRVLQQKIPPLEAVARQFREKSTDASD